MHHCMTSCLASNDKTLIVNFNDFFVIVRQVKVAQQRRTENVFQASVEAVLRTTDQCHELRFSMHCILYIELPFG